MTNGLDVSKIAGLLDAIQIDSDEAKSSWQMTTTWQGGARNLSQCGPIRLGSQTIAREFSIAADEPSEIGGSNQSPNPQELLLAAVNACIMTTFVAQCALRGISIETLSLTLGGDIDLRGFFGIDPSVSAGYDALEYVIEVKADAPREALEEVHAVVIATSPNYFNMVNAIQMNSKLKTLA